MSEAAETSVAVLRTRLFAEGGEPPAALRNLPERFRINEIAIDEDVEAMSEADWDRALQAVLASDRCITV